MARGEFVVKARIEAEDRASGPIGKAESSFRNFGKYVTTVFAVGVVAALTQVRRLFDAIFDSARLTGQTQALRSQLALQGQAFDTYIAKLNEVARGTISTADLIKSSSQALLLGIPADKIAKLLDIARASAIATGRSTAEAFNDIATGIGRASPLILDNLGIVVRMELAYRELAETLGKSTEELTASERKIAILNQVLEVGEGRVRAYGDAQNQLAQGIEKGQAAVDNFQAGFGKLLAALTARGIGIVVDVAASFLNVGIAINAAQKAFNEWTGDLEDVAAAEAQIAALVKMRDGWTEAAEAMFKFSQIQFDQVIGRGADEMQRAAEASASLASSFDASTARLKELDEHFEKTRFGVTALTTEEEKLGATTDGVAQAFESATDTGSALVQQLSAVSRQAQITAASLQMIPGVGGGQVGPPINGGNRVAVLDSRGNRIGSRFVTTPGFPQQRQAFGGGGGVGSGASYGGYGYTTAAGGWWGITGLGAAIGAGGRIYGYR